MDFKDIATFYHGNGKKMVTENVVNGRTNFTQQSWKKIKKLVLLFTTSKLFLFLLKYKDP